MACAFHSTALTSSALPNSNFGSFCANAADGSRTGCDDDELREACLGNLTFTFHARSVWGGILASTQFGVARTAGYDEGIRTRFGTLVVLAALGGDASAAPDPTAPSTFTPISIPPVVERGDWEISLLEPPGRIAVPGTVQGLLWTSGLGEPRGPANGGNYVFSFDGQVGEPVAFVAPDGVSTFVGKGRGERGGDTEKVKMLRPGVANDWKLTAAAHIVELEVSRRRGRAALPPGSISNLIASKVRVLDRRAFAGSIADVISWAARDFDAVVREKGQAPLLDSMHRLNVHPTWSRDRKQLAIRFVLRAMGPEAHPLQCAPCIPGRECACAYRGVALAGEYAFDAKARLIQRTFYLPRPQDLTVFGGRIL